MKKKGYAFMVVSLFLLFYVFVPAVHAEDSKQLYEVGTDNLNVRKAPSRDAEVIGKLQPGDSVTAFQEKHGWVQTYYAGEKAWVASQYLQKANYHETNEQTIAVSNTITITEDAVHLRSGPGTDHIILGFAANGDTFNLVETTNQWHQIDLGNGTHAWVAAWLTDHPTTNRTTSDNHEASSNSEQNTTIDTSNAPSTLTGESLASLNIMLDPGHGGNDPGAIGLYGEEEQDLTLQFTRTVAEKLRNEGATVLLTRSTNSYVSLSERMRINDAYMIDAFISLHFNASPNISVNGVSTHYYEDGPDQQLAQSIQQALSKYTTLKDRGIMQNNFYVLRENSAVSTLVELGFITNPYDLRVIHSSQNPLAVSEAIAEGLGNYFH